MSLFGANKCIFILYLFSNTSNILVNFTVLFDKFKITIYTSFTVENLLHTESHHETRRKFMKKQAFCVHTHFYQPPRENPFTGKIPNEPGAAPFPNWNEQIYNQCYKPNAELGNFSRISFNLGPTLAEWMAEFHPETLQQIIDQETAIYQKFGVGNGMAQAYNHTILPLATHEDKITQIHWGIADFVYHFGHKPEGMWLPETAVDLETLSVLESQGIRFTILAPWQARQRTDFDVTSPYWVELPGDKKIAVFFYDADLSMKVSFMPEVTVNADDFLKNQLLPSFPENSRKERYRIIASDGELYGHHQPFRDKFLEWLTTGALRKNPGIENVFPALWLQQYPPEKSIRIINNTSWSCHHGVKRWATVCPCAEHGEWKAGMRHAFNRIAQIVDTEMQKALDPYGWNLVDFRNEYASVLTHQETDKEQLDRLIGRSLPEEETTKLIYLMQAQYERQRMFTSCGWFFGDFERIEARNNLAYAAMAIELVERVTGNTDYRKQIRRALSKVKSETSGLRASTVFDHASGKTEALHPIR